MTSAYSTGTGANASVDESKDRLAAIAIVYECMISLSMRAEERVRALPFTTSGTIVNRKRKVIKDED